MNWLFIVRPMMKAADRARRLVWRLRGKTIYGVMALAYTPSGRLMLIRQTYLAGWCLPGGGRRPSEGPVDAALRELRQEVGLVGWTSATWLATLERRLSGAPALIDLVRVEGAEFRFRPNLETEEVSTFDPEDLPSDTNSWSITFIHAEKKYRISQHRDNPLFPSWPSPVDQKTGWFAGSSGSATNTGIGETGE